MHLIQLVHPHFGRRLAQVQNNDLVLIGQFDSAFQLAQRAIEQKLTLIELVKQNLSSDKLSYPPIYVGTGEWKILPAFDHPADPRFCMISGTGLTHKASAQNRQHMHEAKANAKMTDSMIMYEWGLDGGKPKPGTIGAQPEWFYKGNGTQLKAHGDPLIIPNYGLDGGEEPEIAGIYINDNDGMPHRVGFATGNEFSDHIMERKNYLYLAPSKIRNCALGPELVLSAEFKSISGHVSIVRLGTTIWEKSIHTGEDHITHSLENLEYHHFKYDNHRLPGDVHIHFMGTSAFSFGAGISLQDGDLMQIKWEGMGKPLMNRLTADLTEKKIIPIHPA